MSNCRISMLATRVIRASVRCYQLGRVAAGSGQSYTHTGPRDPFHGGARPSNPVSIAAGGDVSAAILADGRAFVWGSGPYGELGLGNAVTHVASPCLVDVSGIARVDLGHGSTHAVLIDAQGDVFCSGTASEGQLALGGRLGPAGSYHGGSQMSNVYAPGRVPPFLAPGDRVVQAAPSRNRTVFVTARGLVFVSGTGFSGELGLGSDTLSLSPTMWTAAPPPPLSPPPPPPSAAAPRRLRRPTTMASAPPGSASSSTLPQFASVACGMHFTLAATRDGRVYFCGRIGRAGVRSVLVASTASTATAGPKIESSERMSLLPMQMDLPGAAENGAGTPLQIAAGLHHAAITDGISRVWLLGPNFEADPDVLTGEGSAAKLPNSPRPLGIGPHSLDLRRYVGFTPSRM